MGMENTEKKMTDYDQSDLGFPHILQHMKMLLLILALLLITVNLYWMPPHLVQPTAAHVNIAREKLLVAAELQTEFHPKPRFLAGGSSNP